MRLFRIFLSVYLIQFIFIAKADAMGQKFYDATLSIEFREKHAVLLVHYVNSSNAEIYIDPSAPSLQVKDANGLDVSFIGPIVKRLPLKISEYIKLQPGQSYVKEIDLNRLYLLAREGTYTVCMLSGYLNPISNEYFEGNKVSVTFKIPIELQ